ncbi:MAG: glycoside hydrolase family 28 protein [Bacteroidales bacterium]|nr:glycoside hydrolase family 28 protein [Bacteroidales bacterium]
MYKLKYTVFVIALCIVFLALDSNIQNEVNWSEKEKILEKIKGPSFKNKEYNISDFGAVSDGITNNTSAIQQAIDSCSKSGGGKVIVPPGKFYTAALKLKSNVNLYLDEGAVLIFSTNPDDYKPLVLTRWEGIDCYNYSPLIFAYKQENIAITGKGKLDGQASEDNWWKWKGNAYYGWEEGTSSQITKGRPLLIKYNRDEIPVENRHMGDSNYLRPPFIQLYECKNILLKDFTIERSPFWIIHPLLSQNIIVKGLVINSDGPNSDGCDPESCKDVLIDNCFFNTGDDCIAIKSGRNQDGRRWNMPSENIVVQNCIMKNGHGGFVIGSEISGGCRNVFVENCEMSSPELERAIRIKTNSYRGGVVENIFVRNIKVGEVKEAVVKINCKYDKTELDGHYYPLVKNVYISDIISQKSKYGLHLTGIEGQLCVDSIFILNCDFKGVTKNYSFKDVSNINLKNVLINNELVTLK